MPGVGLLYTLLWLLIIGFIIGLIFWALERYCPEPPKSIFKMIMVIVIIISFILWLIGMLPAEPGIFPYGHH